MHKKLDFRLCTELKAGWGAQASLETARGKLCLGVRPRGSHTKGVCGGRRPGAPQPPGGQLAKEPLGPDLSPWHHRGWVCQQGTETAARRGQPWGAHTLNPAWAPGSASASFKQSALQASPGPGRAQVPVGDRGSRGWAGRPPAPRERRPQVQPPPGACSQPPRPALPQASRSQALSDQPRWPVWPKRFLVTQAPPLASNTRVCLIHLDVCSFVSLR